VVCWSGRAGTFYTTDYFSDIVNSSSNFSYEFMLELSTSRFDIIPFNEIEVYPLSD
jgi:hypothetical protein